MRGQLRAMDELLLQRLRDGVAVRAVHGARATIGIVELDAGAIVAEHQHEYEQLGIVLDGSVRFRIEGIDRELHAGGAYQVPPGLPHEVTAGLAGAVVLDVFVPRRDDWRGIVADKAGEMPRWPS